MQTPGRPSIAHQRGNLPDPAKSRCELKRENIYHQGIEINTAVYSMLRLTLLPKNHRKLIVNL